MKKIFFAAAMTLATMTISAQNEEQKDYLPDGIYTVEWRFNPFDYESKPTNMAQLNGRLFLNDKSAVRAGIGFGLNNDKDETAVNKDSRASSASNYDIENTNTTTKNQEMSLKLAIGYEYHFASTGCLDFYAGAEAGYLGRFYSATKNVNSMTTNVTTAGNTVIKTQSVGTEDYEYTKSNADRTKFNEDNFFGTVFTGIDFYVYKKLYVGAELGLTFSMGKKANGSYTSEITKRTVVGANETANWTQSYSSENGATVYIDHLNSNNNKTTCDYVTDHSGSLTKIYIEPAIRIGWMF